MSFQQDNLPTEEARLPEEAAQQQLDYDELPTLHGKHSQRVNCSVTFAENTASATMSASQKSSASYKDVLSQPSSELSHRQRLLWLQQRRSSGLWVQCNDCSKWRYLANVLDRHELPVKWNCHMNRNKSVADCSVPEEPMNIRDEEDCIHGEYAAGSVVWARMGGWPWWPAMVDDCPDTEQYYWLDGFSDIPTHYNVVFFDTNDVTRAWVTPEHMKPYTSNKTIMKSQLYTQKNKYRKRINAAMAQADDADRLPLKNRLAKYSFITRYKGKIVTPKKINKKQLKKIEKIINRKFNIRSDGDSSSQSSSDSDEVITNYSSRNVYVFGTQNTRDDENTHRFAKEKASGTKKDLLTVLPSINEDLVDSHNNKLPEPNSISGQVGSSEHLTCDIKPDDTKDNFKTSEPQVETTNIDGHEFTIRIASPHSDDFEF